MKAKLVIFIFSLGVGVCFADTWYNERREFLDSVSDNPTGSQMERLLRLVDIPSRNDDAVAISKMAREKISSIPDFSGKLGGFIRELRDRWKSGDLKGFIESGETYDKVRYGVIDGMGGVQDVGIVRELGELLDDMEWTVDPIEHMNSGADWSLTPPNGYLAAESLAALIDDPPNKKDPKNYIEDDLEDWRLWYARVKAGNQTFRFKGDPQEYTLAGPSDRKIEDLSASRRSREKTPGSSGGVSDAEANKPSETPWIAVIGALGLCLAAVWLAVKKRKARV